MSEADARSIMPTIKSSIIKYFGGLCFSRDLEQPDFVYLLLDPEKVKVVDDLGPRAISVLNQKDIPIQLGKREVELTFEKMNLKQLIAAYLNIHPGLITFGRTELIGHVVVVELHDALLPYKETIGRIIIEKKKPQIRAVLNTLGKLRSEYRIFPTEVLAKENDDTSLAAEVEAVGCRFKLDFGKVFWNFRRNDEHLIISNLVNPGDIMYDVCAGIGPFSIPAAKRGGRVLANDINPECVRWLAENARLNDVESRFQCYNEDGGHFISQTIKQDIIKEWRKQDMEQNFHIVINLPASSLDFLPAFKDWVSDHADELRDMKFNLPFVHLYTFMHNLSPSAMDIRCREVLHQMVEYYVGPLTELTNCVMCAHCGTTRMYRISFRLPAAITGLHKKNLSQ